MAIKKYKPVTPSLRGMTGYMFEEITKSTPERSLLISRRSNGGRNAQGKITVRHQGGGARRHIRLVDFKRGKHGIPARVSAIEYDPNRSARIALLEYADGEKSYILAPEGLKAGDRVQSGDEIEPRVGNCLPLKKIPLGMAIHNVELHPGRGGQMCRSAGIGAGATSGGAMDASNLLKPALASGTIRCIGSTTYKEYRQYFEKDRALVRRFQKIDVNEPSVPDAIEILKGLKPYFEDYHKLKYTNEAIKAAVELSSRYIHDRKLPDKAIDVIDESGAAQMLLPESRRKKTIGIKEIETTISTMARIPPKTVSKDDAEVLLHLEQTLKTVVYGQDKAIESLSASIKLARAGLREPEKPIGCYLFSGPTGVGKTEVAKQLAASLGVELIRFDMSEYMERHTVSRLIGAPPGYVGFDQGGLLTDGVDQHPHCVLLLDEIEKAHPDLFNVLLQVMDHGKLTDHNGKQVDFRNVILIMTTNAGASDLAKQAYGFTRSRREGDDQEAINKMFAPEFRNRLDATITFAHLSQEVIAKVVEKFVLQLEAQLGDRNVTIELSEEASRWLIANGYDELMGARPMARVIQEHIKKPLADEVLFGHLKSGGHVRVIVDKDEQDRDKLGFQFLDGPVTPKPEKLPAPKPKAKRRSPPRPKPKRGSVPKVPLAKV